jgi:hypothetical protein
MKARISILSTTQKLTIFFLLMFCLSLTACNWFRDFDFARGARVTGGDPEAGRKKAIHAGVRILSFYSRSSAGCRQERSVARGLVGPPHLPE